MPQQQPEAAAEAPMPTEGGGGKPMGPVIGAAIIVAILIIGGIYFWGTLSSRDTQDMTGAQILNQSDGALKDLKKQSNSDLLADIEKDLNNTDIENLDAELENIESELNNL